MGEGVEEGRSERWYVSMSRTYIGLLFLVVELNKSLLLLSSSPHPFLPHTHPRTPYLSRPSIQHDPHFLLSSRGRIRRTENPRGASTGGGPKEAQRQRQHSRSGWTGESPWWRYEGRVRGVAQRWWSVRAEEEGKKGGGEEDVLEGLGEKRGTGELSLVR